MKLISGLNLREIAGEMIIIPTGQAAKKISGVAMTNEVGCFLFHLLSADQTEESLLEAVLKEYDVDRATAEADIKEYIEILRGNDLLVESEPLR